MDHSYIFSYGSNMLFDRIRQRIDSVEVVCRYILTDYTFAFNKRSHDNSSKANLIHAPGETVQGVIHQISKSDKQVLDQYEGLGKGYEMEYFSAQIQGDTCAVGFYMVKDDDFLCDDQPYCWYLQCVMYGALENCLTTSYIREIQNQPFKPDTDKHRNKYYDALLKSHRSRYRQWCHPLRTASD
ncbi:MAG: gamma-glutamylcyclotransferase, partial [Cyclobacteriaceae bacterium]